MVINTIDVELVRRCFMAGAGSLDAHKEIVNELNVFPVPDGDTGTNMTMTIMSAAREVAALDNPDMESLCKAISGGSLKGARGNSGVILSQLLRGFTKSISDMDKIDTSAISTSFERAVGQAYKAVMKPKEGTILTVARAAAEKALEMSEITDNMAEQLNAVIMHMQDVLEQTPDMLPVLKEAGVVDSGGQGLLYIMQGAYDALIGKEVSTEVVQPEKVLEQSNLGDGAGITGAGADIHAIADADIKYGYCTEFIILLEKEFTEDDEEKIKDYLTSIGDSLVCVADDDVVKIHVHTNDPGLAIQKALTYGQLSRMKIDNMRLEHHERIIKDSERLAREQKAVYDSKKSLSRFDAPKVQNGFISISVGAGLSEIFTELGVDVVIEGGQTMNPSTEDILDAVSRINADNVFILPNNSNITLAANQAKDMTEDKNVIVIPTQNIPQGIAAMTGFIDGVSPEKNEKAMNDAIAPVKSGQVTYAVRDTSVDGHDIKFGDIMGLTGKTIEAVGKDVVETTIELLENMIDEDSELITIYYGEDGSESDARKITERLALTHSDIEYDIENGGQPIYYYLVSVE